MIISERANELVAGVGNLLGEISPDKGLNKEGVKRLEEMISKYIFLEGKKVVNDVQNIQDKDIERWEYNLDIYNKIAGILFDLNGNAPGITDKIANFFELKMINLILSGVFLKGSKVFEKMNENKKITVDKNIFDKDDKEFEKLGRRLIEEYLNNPIPYIEHKGDSEEYNIKFPTDRKEKEHFFLKGDIVLWYLAYLLAVAEIERKKERQKSNNPTELKKTEEKLRAAMKEYMEPNRGRLAEQRGR